MERTIEASLRDVLGIGGFEMISKLLPIDLAAADPRRLHELLVSIFEKQGALLVERDIASRLLRSLGEDSSVRQERSPEERKSKAELQHDADLLSRFAEAAALPGARPKGFAQSLDSAALNFVQSLAA